MMRQETKRELILAAFVVLATLGVMVAGSIAFNWIDSVGEDGDRTIVNMSDIGKLYDRAVDLDDKFEMNTAVLDNVLTRLESLEEKQRVVVQGLLGAKILKMNTPATAQTMAPAVQAPTAPQPEQKEQEPEPEPEKENGDET